MHDPVVKIEENQRVNGKYYKLAFSSKELAAGVHPGQFLNVLVNDAMDPFLRRPFSYYRVHGSRIELLYEILGRGTAILAGKQPGDTLKVLGPLGKPFSRKVPQRKRILVAGGVGVPPLIFLAENLKVNYLLIGAKSKLEVMPEAELRHVQGEVRYATNDGSFGEKGFVTLLLKQILEKEDPSDVFIQTCGPKPMMHAVFEMAAEYSVAGEASMDETMACGVGACLGCMVRTDRGWTPSCTHGPVFSFAELK